MFRIYMISHLVGSWLAVLVPILLAVSVVFVSNGFAVSRCAHDNGQLATFRDRCFPRYHFSVMPPKKDAKTKKKKGVELPKEIPDLEWEPIPHIASTYNQIYNQKIRIRIRALFSVFDSPKKKRIDSEKTAMMIRAVGLSPSDDEMDAWIKSIGKHFDDDETLYVERDTLCNGIYEVCETFQ